MCQPGNQSIFKECRDKALKELGKQSAPNVELRKVIAYNNGCMSHNGNDEGFRLVPTWESVPIQKEPAI